MAHSAPPPGCPVLCGGSHLQQPAGQRGGGGGGGEGQGGGGRDLLLQSLYNNYSQGGGGLTEERRSHTRLSLLTDIGHLSWDQFQLKPND